MSQSSEPLFFIGIMAIAAISLRSPANSEALCDNCVAEVITQGMKEHSGSAAIQVKLALIP